MIDFITNYAYQNIKVKLFLLYILNVSDIIFTILLLKTGFYVEVNGLMVKVVQSLIGSFIWKILLPGALLICIYYRMSKATSLQLKHSNFFVSGAILFYTFINISHLIGFTILLISTSDLNNSFFSFLKNIFYI